MKKVLSPVGSMQSITHAVVGVSAGPESASKTVNLKAFASNPVPSKKRTNQSTHSNGYHARGPRPATGATKGGNPGVIPGKKKSTGGLYPKSQSSDHLSGTHSSKKALVRSKQSASQTILKTHDAQIVA